MSRSIDVTPSTQWKYEKLMTRKDIERVSDNEYLVYTHYKGKLVSPIKTTRFIAEKLKDMKVGLVRDKEKNNHAVIKKKGFNCPLYYFVLMKYDLVPEKDNNRFNDYFVLFKDGDINNLIPSNIIEVKITKELAAKKKAITDRYIKNEEKGSNKEVQAMFFKEAMKIYNFPNAAIDSNLNNAWEQHPKGGKRPIPNFQHITNNK